MINVSQRNNTECPRYGSLNADIPNSWYQNFFFNIPNDHKSLNIKVNY